MKHRLFWEKNSLKQLLLLIFSAFLCCAPAQSQVANVTGSGFDPDSRKSLIIRINLQNSYKISRTDDISLYVNDRNKDYSVMEGICIEGNKNDRFRMTAHTATTDELVLINEEGDKLPFDLFLFPDKKSYVGEQIHSQKAGTEFVIPSSDQNCKGEDSSLLHFVFTSQNLKNAKGGVYSADLVLAIGGS